MKKIKILRIISRLNIGGPAVHVILLTAGLDKDRFDSLLICGNIGRDEGDMLYYSVRKNIKPYLISELKREINLLNDIIAFIKIYKIIRKEKPDIICSHTAKAGALGRLAAIIYNLLNKDAQIKMVHTFHGHIFEGYFTKFKTKLFILIEQFLASFTYIIITLSESIKKELVSLNIANENKIEIISLGLELENFLEIPIREDAVFNIGIVGRLVPIKNHRLFLKSAAGVIHDSPEMRLKFWIIGDGELREDLERYAKELNIVKKIEFSGWKRDSVSIYSDLDVVAFTSKNEGTPVSLIEAMASAKAIVSTDVGGIRDLLGKEVAIYKNMKANFKILERGVIVNSEDSDNFAAALIFILQNRNLRINMGISARDFARSRFIKEKLIKDMENLYCRISNSA